jgi:hypothetical protein
MCTMSHTPHLFIKPKIGHYLKLFTVKDFIEILEKHKTLKIF